MKIEEQIMAMEEQIAAYKQEVKRRDQRIRLLKSVAKYLKWAIDRDMCSCCLKYDGDHKQ